MRENDDRRDDGGDYYDEDDDTSGDVAYLGVHPTKSKAEKPTTSARSGREPVVRDGFLEHCGPLIYDDRVLLVNLKDGFGRQFLDFHRSKMDVGNRGVQREVIVIRLRPVFQRTSFQRPAVLTGGDRPGSRSWSGHV